MERCAWLYLRIFLNTQREWNASIHTQKLQLLGATGLRQQAVAAAFNVNRPMTFNPQTSNTLIRTAHRHFAARKPHCF